MQVTRRLGHVVSGSIVALPRVTARSRIVLAAYNRRPDISMCVGKPRSSSRF